MGQSCFGPTDHTLVCDRIKFPVSSDISLGQGYNLIDDSVCKSIMYSISPSFRLRRKIDYSHYSSTIIRSRKDIRKFLQIPTSKEMKSLAVPENQGKLENILKSFEQSTTSTQLLIKFVYKNYKETIDNENFIVVDQKIVNEIQSPNAFLANYGDHFCVERVYGGLMLIMMTIDHNTPEDREKMERELKLEYSIVNPMKGFDRDVFEKIDKEKVHFTIHYLGVDNVESEKFGNIDELMIKLQEFQKKNETKTNAKLIEISIQSYKHLSAFRNHNSLVRDPTQFMRELNDILMYQYGSYYDFKNQAELILEEYLKDQEKYEKLDTNKLSNIMKEVNDYLEKIWKYYNHHANGVEIKEELDIKDPAVFQSENILPKLKLKSPPEEL